MIDTVFTFTTGLWIGAVLGVVAGVLLVWDHRFAKGWEAAHLERVSVLWRLK